MPDTYDIRCWELAHVFVSDVGEELTHEARTKLCRDLAHRIQDEIENFLGEHGL